MPEIEMNEGHPYLAPIPEHEEMRISPVDAPGESRAGLNPLELIYGPLDFEEVREANQRTATANGVNISNSAR